MRSSKSRSRSKSNRPRSIGNIVNRVFDSSGPEGKVRGTPQQIIEKYQFLARDAQLSNDRVAAENFMQHAEHYTRMLAEAQRELAAEQEQRRPQGDYSGSGSQNGNQNGNQNGQQGQGGYQGGQPNQNRDQQYRDPQNRDQPFRDQQNRDQQRDRPYRDERSDMRDEQPDVVVVPRSTVMMDFIDELGDSGLVETPEARHRPEPPRAEANETRSRAPLQTQGDRPERKFEASKPRKPQMAAPAAVEASVVAVQGAASQAPRKPRAPRKPKTDATSPEGDGPAEAAE